MALDLVRVIIFTNDVSRLFEFYKRAFGMVPVGVPDADWAELSSNACNLAFHKTLEVLDGSDNGIKLVFGTSDVESEKRRLEGLGISMTKIFDFENIRMCNGQDPDGNRFQISSRAF